MSDTPAVSIIMATFNWSSVLRCAVQSVLRQTFDNFELLVIGDGCTDDSEAVVASFADPRVRWHNLSSNSGHQSTPNNAGLALARAPYVAYHGHDDIWHPRHLELLTNAIRTHDADLAHSIGVMIGPQNSGIRIVTGIFPGGLYSPKMFLPPSSILHRRDIVEKAGNWRHYRTLNTPPDKEFVDRLWEHRHAFASVNELTVFKFNSAWRKNSYQEKPCDEQTAYLRRIQEEPDFIARELMAITTAYVIGNIRGPAHFKEPKSAPPGWMVDQWRRERGLEPRAAEVPPAKGIGRLFGRLRKKKP